jgi:hypothetical protein
LTLRIYYSNVSPKRSTAILNAEYSELIPQWLIPLSQGLSHLVREPSRLFSESRPHNGENGPVGSARGSPVVEPEDQAFFRSLGADAALGSAVAGLSFFPRPPETGINIVGCRRSGVAFARFGLGAGLASAPAPPGQGYVSARPSG